MIAPAFADDWQAVKLRGIVLQLMDNQWRPLQRGDIVPDTRVIRTTVSGRVQFVRGGETIDLEPNTQIQIFDKAHHQKPYTTITQYFGTVSVEAQVQNVQHFAVDTPFLAAVVKGTRFVVGSDMNGASVKVNRGHVAVTDKLNKTHVLLGVGQSALVDKVKTGGALLVQGAGNLPPVLDSRNRPVGGSGDTSDAGTEGLDLSIAGNLARLQVGGSGGLVNLGVGGNLANVTLGGSSGLADIGVGGGLAGVNVGGSNGLANVNVGGGNGINANVGGGGGLVSVGAGNSGGGGGGGGVSVNVGGGGGLVNVNVGGLHLGL